MCRPQTGCVKRLFLCFGNCDSRNMAHASCYSPIACMYKAAGITPVGQTTHTSRTARMGSPIVPAAPDMDFWHSMQRVDTTAVFLMRSLYCHPVQFFSYCGGNCLKSKRFSYICSGSQLKCLLHSLSFGISRNNDRLL